MSFAIDSREARSKESMAERLEFFAPLMPRAVVNELCSGRHMQEYRTRKLAWFRALTYQAIWEQQQMHREVRERETRFADGLGQHRMIVHPRLHAIAEAKWGRGCWSDKSFRNHTLERSPELRVPTPARRLFPVNGFKDSRRPGSTGISIGQPGGAGNTKVKACRRGCDPAPTISEHNERNT
jgi:hypothetical protein